MTDQQQFPLVLVRSGAEFSLVDLAAGTIEYGTGVVDHFDTTDVQTGEAVRPHLSHDGSHVFAHHAGRRMMYAVVTMLGESTSPASARPVIRRRVRSMHRIAARS